MPRPELPTFAQGRWDLALLPVLEDAQTSLDTHEADLATNGAEIAAHGVTLGTHTSELADHEARVTTAENRQGRLQLVGFDDFADHPNGAVAGLSQVLGSPWKTTGATLPTVVSGRAHCVNGTGYLFETFDPKPTFIGAAISFGGSGSDAAFGLVFTRDGSGNGANLTQHLLHLTVSPLAATLTTRQDGGAFPVVGGFTWDTPLKLDGTVYQIGLSFQGDVATIYGPNGEVVTNRDPRIAAALAGYDGSVYWQPTGVGATKAYLHRTYAFADSGHGWSALSDYMTNLAAAGRSIGGVGEVIGSKYKLGQVAIGTSGQYATLYFGPEEIRTTLMAPMSIAATSFQCDQIIPSGSSVVIGAGAGAETLTTSGFPAGGSAPFTVSTSGGAAKAHVTGEPVIATVTQRVRVYLNPANGILAFPSPFWIEGNDFYLGSDLSVRLYRSAANVASLGSGDSFTVDGTWNGGTIRLGVYYLWVDGSGNLRIKSGAPSSAADGTIVGTQS